MRRRTFLAGLFAVPVAVACDPVRGVSPVPWPVDGGDDVGMSTQGLAAVVAGEDWHYVGEAGEPAFENSWTNATSGDPKLAFRIREAGVVDIQGVVQRSTASASAIFTLPAGYRPSNRAYVVANGLLMSTLAARSGWFDITSAGVVSPVMFTGNADYIVISGQFFLTSPDPV